MWGNANNRRSCGQVKELDMSRINELFTNPVVTFLWFLIPTGVLWFFGVVALGMGSSLGDLLFGAVFGGAVTAFFFTVSMEAKSRGEPGWFYTFLIFGLISIAIPITAFIKAAY